MPEGPWSNNSSSNDNYNDTSNSIEWEKRGIELEYFGNFNTRGILLFLVCFSNRNNGCYDSIPNSTDTTESGFKPYSSASLTNKKLTANHQYHGDQLRR